MARTKNQGARRAQLTAATIRIIAEDGLAAVSFARAAEAVGVSARLVAYYYPDVESLIEAAHEVAVERYYWSRLRATDRTADPEERLGRLIASGLPTRRDRELSQVLNELGVNASRSPVHARLMGRLYDEEVSLYLAVLEDGTAAGTFELVRPALEVARNLVALEDAYGVHLLARRSPVTRRAAHDALLGYARAATGATLVTAR